MSNLTDILTGSIRIKRKSDSVLDETGVTTPISFDRNPSESARLNITLTGATVNTGVVNVTGSTTETFSFSDNTSIVGIKDFSTVTSLTLSGISEGFISVQAVDSLGSPITQELIIHNQRDARVYPESNGDKLMRMSLAGYDQAGHYNLMLAPDTRINENDIINVLSGIQGLTLGQVENVHQIVDFVGVTHHIECDVREI